MKKRIKYQNYFNALSGSIFEDNISNPYALDQLIKYGRMCMDDPKATDKEVYQAVRQSLEPQYLPLLDLLVIVYAPDYAD